MIRTHSEGLERGLANPRRRDARSVHVANGFDGRERLAFVHQTGVFTLNHCVRPNGWSAAHLLALALMLARSTRGWWAASAQRDFI